MLNNAVPLWFKKFVEKKGLESSFLDFLTIILPLEYSGLKLDQIFLEAVKGGVTLPKPYLDLAKRFYSIYVVTQDPYDSVKALASTVPWDKLRVFLNGYVDVSLRVGDSVRYVESFVEEELGRLRSRVEEVFNLIDNLFEAYLIVALGIVVYFSLPIVPIPALVFSTLISAISTVAFLASIKILNLASLDMDVFSFYLTLTLLVSTPFITNVLGDLFYLHSLTIIAIGLILYLINRRFLLLDVSFNSFVENVYAEAKEGYPIDQAVIRASSTCGNPVKWIGVLMNLGFKSTSIINVFKLPKIHRRVLNSIIAPVGYCKVSISYLNVVLKVLDNLRSLRARLGERTRVYYFYVGLMLVALITVIKVFSTIPGFGFKPSIGLIQVVYSTIVASLILASCFRNGFWYSSILFYIYLVVVTVVLKIVS